MRMWVVGSVQTAQGFSGGLVGCFACFLVSFGLACSVWV